MKRKPGKPKTKKLEGQGTLLSFVGKAELPPLKHTAPTTQRMGTSTASWSQASGNPQNFGRIKAPTQVNEQIGIEPSLADHRLGSKKLLRPGRENSNAENPRNDYVFLSSSPLKIKARREEELSPHTSSSSLSTKPPLLPLVRPAVSLHNTSVNMLRNPDGQQKTLGMRRSMKGWSARKGTGFVPPTMKRPM